MDKTNINANVDTDLQEQGNGENTAENTDVRTFTQEQVDNIVEKRLAKERKRLMSMISDDEELKAEYLKNKLQLEAHKRLMAAEYPLIISDILDYSSEESFNKSYETVTKTFDEALSCRINEIFKANSRTPGKAAKSGDEAFKKVFGL